MKRHLAAVAALTLPALNVAPALAHDTTEVWWLLPEGGSPSNVTWPQTYLPDSTVPCDRWAQVDRYPVSAIPALIADGLLSWVNGQPEDHAVVISWRFEQGPPCETPTSAPTTVPTTEPTTAPTTEPSAVPTTAPTEKPTGTPITEPAPHLPQVTGSVPTALAPPLAVTAPTSAPTTEPTAEATTTTTLAATGADVSPWRAAGALGLIGVGAGLIVAARKRGA